jgi:transketolase
VQQVDDGNDLEAVDRAIRAAKEDPRPSIIACRTHIGFGLPKKQDTASAHGEPAGEEELAGARKNLGWPEAARFHVPAEGLAEFTAAADRGRKAHRAWDDLRIRYRRSFPDVGVQFDRALARTLPAGLATVVPTFPADSKGMATRASSGKVLNALATVLPELMGGSADLSGSNQTVIKDASRFTAGDRSGRYLHFGVREHGMGAILSGMALEGGLIPYGGTFLVFSDYMRPSIRLASLMGLRVIYVFTHDSIGLGEDGPTHQPIEHLAALRAIPNLTLIRPADANETREAWLVAVSRVNGPTALALTRQAVPTFDRGRFASADGARRGAYVLADLGRGKPEVILMGSGSEVAILVEAGERLAKSGRAVRLVSFPSWQLFEEQSEAYRRSVLPPAIRARVAIEAGVPQGWERWVGEQGIVIGLDHFGASAPYQELYQHFGLTADAVVRAARKLLRPRARASGRAASPKGAPVLRSARRGEARKRRRTTKR